MILRRSGLAGGVHHRRSPTLFFPPLELESQFFIEEHLKDTNVSVVRHRHRRPSRKSAATKFLVALLFAATAAITWQFARQQPASSMSYVRPEFKGIKLNDADPALSADRSYSSFLDSRPGRPVYLHSVIPGGIASAEELRQAMDHDPVVAQQFAGFDFERAHLVQVSEKEAMHVAYRMGQKVYWTRKKVTLHPGETLISDGKIVARTRCGNRIAMTPLGPPALTEPADADLNQPLFANDMVTPAADPQPEAYAAVIPMASPIGANALQPVKHRRMIPFFVLPFFGLPGTGGGGTSHTPLAVTPEPGTLMLFSSGLAGVLWKLGKSGRKR
jgi:PEP-CTERM motif